MIRPVRGRAVRSLALVALAFAVFEGCSNSGDDVGTVSGPPSMALNPLASTLPCDNALVVSVALENITLKPPYNCGTQPQCGSLQVSLLETEDGAPLVSVRAATPNVELDLSSLVAPASADAPTLDRVHFVRAELFGDTLAPYPAPSGGGPFQVTAPLTLTASTDCTGGGGAPNNGGAAGANEAGANEAGAGSGGQSGEGGAPNTGAGGAPETAGASNAGESGAPNAGAANAGAPGSSTL